ncbi:MAG: SPFH domain-containing protein [Lachnospiraceae bacterium]|nr:SPFH domain-containing protein [Lachnospiraceae bacterium]
MDNTKTTNINVQEKELRPASGIVMLFLNIIAIILEVVFFIVGCGLAAAGSYLTVIGVLLLPICVIFFIISCILFGGLKTVKPNEAMVLTLFGKYHGTIKKSGFFLVNPFASAFNPGLTTVTQPNGQRITVGSKTVSMKVRTLDNQRQKVNDILGNPIIIGAIVIWKVVDPTKAVFAVENYNAFLSIQCDSTIRNIARLYPYDDMDDKDGIDEKTLRGSSQEIADRMRDELQTRVAAAGLEIIEVRITHLSYSEEIAAAMLQRQQAVAIIAARKKIVEGAVSMVEMAIDQLGKNNIVNLDDERKAQMVSNLMVVLCGNKEAQPIVNSGSIY